jgi:hypothetical protein
MWGTPRPTRSTTHAVHTAHLDGPAAGAVRGSGLGALLHQQALECSAAAEYGGQRHIAAPQGERAAGAVRHGIDGRACLARHRPCVQQGPLGLHLAAAYGRDRGKGAAAHAAAPHRQG